MGVRYYFYNLSRNEQNRKVIVDSGEIWAELGYYSYLGIVGVFHLVIAANYWSRSDRIVAISEVGVDCIAYNNPWLA